MSWPLTLISYLLLFLVMAYTVQSGAPYRRGTGDIWTMTVEEYRRALLPKKMAYRIYRNPFVLFALGPVFYFLLINRWPSKGARRRDVMSVVITNLAIVLIVVAASLTIGIKSYLLVQLPVVFIAGAAGLWLFYVQHQFQGVYWARTAEWDPQRVALEGASFYRLPRLLQWATGNIGFHRLHHIRPAIPNYHLQACHEAVPALSEVRPLTLRDSLQCARLKLYDERRHEMVSFRALPS